VGRSGRPPAPSGRLGLRTGPLCVSGAGLPDFPGITSPSNGLRLLRDPETPAPLATLGLAAVSSPPAKQILWYVDGRPFSLADYPYSARWPLSPGEHIFQAKLPYTAVASQPVRVTVQ
jgi:penicillin-binding protein 1C